VTDKTPVTIPAYVGLDLSLTGTGFCVKRGCELRMETVKTKPTTSENDLDRLRYIRGRLMELIPADTRMVCVEDFFIPYKASQMNAAKVLIMLGTVVRVALLERGLPFYVVAPGQLKKYATGKGNGPKGVVIREIYKRWGVNAKDDNQADACVLSHMAEMIHYHSRGETPAGAEVHKYQLEMVEKVMSESPSYNVG
jgi:crossover junction endodeoxyribonuclease RuvC